MGYKVLFLLGKLIYKLIVKGTALAFFVGGFVLIMVVLIFPLNLFEQIDRLGDPLRSIFRFLAFILAWVFPAVFVPLIRKTGKVYVMYSCLFIIWLLDVLLIWIYVVQK